MRRNLYTADHEQYRELVREFARREVVPNLERWDEQRMIDREVLASAVKNGLYGLEIPAEHGGSGETDYRYRMVVNEEMCDVGATSFNMTLGLQDDLVLHYLVDLGNDEQHARWLPGFATGETIGALAMTEPAAGSDLRGMKTVAVPDGDGWRLSGQKTFISSGISADLVVVAARSGADGATGFSLFVVEADMPGFSRGRKLDKVGLHAQDTAELFFDNVPVPRENLLGNEGEGLRYLMAHLPRERLGIVASAYAGARAVFELTKRYCFERTAFGKPIGDFQNTRFVLAEMATELDVAQAYVDAQILAYNAGELSATDAAKGKWWLSELQKKIVDQCVQLHGGYGYMLEYPVAKAYIDSRVQTIYAGTTEIMKELIGRELAAGASA